MKEWGKHERALAGMPTRETPVAGIASTGVGGFFSAAHRDTRTGALHGHTWEVTAWVEAGRNAAVPQDWLALVLRQLDHHELPAELAWGEDIAAHIAHQMTLAGAVVQQVDVSRPAERIYARWVALPAASGEGDKA
jgi:6-pyruvoyl-tetrahydropterin synthase